MCLLHVETLWGGNLKAVLHGNSSNCLVICKLHWISPCSSAAGPHCKWQKTSLHNPVLALPSLASSLQHPPSLTSLRSPAPRSLAKVPVLPRCPSQKTRAEMKPLGTLRTGPLHTAADPFGPPGTREEHWASRTLPITAFHPNQTSGPAAARFGPRPCSSGVGLVRKRM